jgi:hypothetical protein
MKKAMTEIVNKHIQLDRMSKAYNIAKEYGLNADTVNNKFEFISMLCYVMEYGRIEGIRSERARKKRG